MKLATLKNGARDGRLVVVSKDLTRYTDAAGIAPTLQAALDTLRCDGRGESGRDEAGKDRFGGGAQAGAEQRGRVDTAV